MTRGRMVGGSTCGGPRPRAVVICGRISDADTAGAEPIDLVGVGISDRAANGVAAIAPDRAGTTEVAAADRDLEMRDSDEARSGDRSTGGLVFV